MKRLLSLAFALALTLGCIAPRAAFADSPCQGPNLNSVVLSSTTAATTQLISFSAGLTTYVCAVFGVASGTSASMTFEYGSGGTCGTGTTALSGVIPVPATATFFSFDNGAGVLYRIPPGTFGNGFCIVNAGPASVIGSVTYIQQ